MPACPWQPLWPSQQVSVMSSAAVQYLTNLSAAGFGFMYCTQYCSLLAQVPVYGGWAVHGCISKHAPREHFVYICMIMLVFLANLLAQSTRHAWPEGLSLSLKANCSEAVSHTHSECCLRFCVWAACCVSHPLQPACASTSISHHPAC